MFAVFGPRGELTIAASVSEPVTIGGTRLTHAGGRGPLVAHYDRGGRPLWSRMFDGADLDEQVGALALDGRGDVVMASSIGVAAPDAPEGSPTTCMIVKLAASDGRSLWSTRVRGTGDQLCRGVAGNTAGDVFAAAAFEGHVDLGSGLDSRGKHDIWLAAFAGQAPSDAPPGWVRQIGGAGNDIVRALAVDNRGDVLLGGQFSGEVPPDQGVLDLGTGPLRSAGDFDALLAKFSAGGTPLWARTFGDVGFDLVKSIAVDGDGNAFISGAWMRPQDFHGQIPLLTGIMDGTIARYAADGSLIWRRVFPGGGSQAHHIALDPAGRIWIAGHFKHTVDLGGRTLHSGESSAAYVAAFSPAGLPVSAALIASPAAHYGYSIAASPDGAIAVGVKFTGTAQLCGQSITAGADEAMLIAVMSPPDAEAH